jgi:PEP-CTERM motif
VTRNAISAFYWPAILLLSILASAGTVHAAPILTTIPADGNNNNFGPVRFGTTSSPETITAKNTGSGTLQGVMFSSPSDPFALVTSAGPFSVVKGQPATADYTYTPGSRGKDSVDIMVTATNGSVSTSTITLNGRGVGPVFRSSPGRGSTLDFGTMSVGVVTSLPLTVSNNTGDPNQGDDTLTDLTLLGFRITGPDAADFSLLGLAPGTVIPEGGLPLDLLVRFTPSHSGIENAELFLSTDVGAPFGTPGNNIHYFLTGDPVPEPSVLMLLGGGLCALAAYRRGKPSLGRLARP